MDRKSNQGQAALLNIKMVHPWPLAPYIDIVYLCRAIIFVMEQQCVVCLPGAWMTLRYPFPIPGLVPVRVRREEESSLLLQPPPPAFVESENGFDRWLPWMPCNDAGLNKRCRLDLSGTGSPKHKRIGAFEARSVGLFLAFCCTRRTCWGSGETPRQCLHRIATEQNLAPLLQKGIVLSFCEQLDDSSRSESEELESGSPS